MNDPAQSSRAPISGDTVSGGTVPGDAVSGGAIFYRLAQGLSDIPEDLELRNVEWGVLLAVTGEHTATEIGDAFGLDDDERCAVFGRLAEYGLVEERAVTYREYLRAQATTGGESQRTLAAFLRAGITLPAPPLNEVDGPPADASTRPIRTRPHPKPAQSAPSVAFTPLQTPRPEAARRLSLKVLIRHILDRSPDLDSGQLDVYRVFIRVDTKLLKRNGIDTLRFEDDRLVDDPELQQAIARSLERTLGMPMPSDVYV